jgi:hypothetical protein
VADASTAIGYIRCSASIERLAYNRDDDWKKPSLSWKNPLYHAQRRSLKRCADDHDLYLWRVFYDPEYNHMGDLVWLPLRKRKELAKLVIDARKRDIRMVLVDKRSRLHRVPVALAVLCR